MLWPDVQYASAPGTASTALAHAKAGNVEEAAASLTAAATKNLNTRSVEKARVMLEARRALPAVDSPALRAADELLRDTGALSPALSTATKR